MFAISRLYQCPSFLDYFSDDNNEVMQGLMIPSDDIIDKQLIYG